MIYAWAPRSIARMEAAGRFEDVLGAQCRDLHRLFANRYTLDVTECGPFLLGQIRSEPRLPACPARFETDTGGWLLSGVCEDLCGRTVDADEIDRAVRDARRHPERIAAWTGRFSAIAFDCASGEVVVFPAAVESIPLWYAEGPLGFAVGTRALPVLALVGREPRIDIESAALFVGFGYLFGPNALFEGVRRVPERARVVLRPREQPLIAQYISLAKLVRRPSEDAGEEPARRGAERLRARVARQLSASPAPMPLLTGGRDSRVIAAALQAAGYAGPVWTAGAPESGDVRIAAQVASHLGLEHRVVDRRGRGLRVGTDEHLKRCLEWSRLSEGMHDIRQAFAARPFLLAGHGLDAQYQLFHGLGGEIRRGFWYRAGALRGLERPGRGEALTRFLRGAISPALRHRRAVAAAIASMVSQFAAELEGVDLATAEWFDLFYWQSRCQHWGADFMSAQRFPDWRWTPLMDAGLVTGALRVSAEEKRSQRFVDRTLECLDAGLQRIPFSGGAPEARWRRSLRTRLPAPLVYRMRQAAFTLRRTGRHEEPGLQRLWDRLFEGGTSDWMEAVMPRRRLGFERVVAPGSPLLWRLATVELAARSARSG